MASFKDVPLPEILSTFAASTTLDQDFFLCLSFSHSKAENHSSSELRHEKPQMLSRLDWGI